MPRLLAVLFAWGGVFLAAPGGAQPDVVKPAPVPVRDMPEFVRRTLADLWESFLSYLPILVVGLLVLLLTGLMARILTRLGARAFARSRMRGSLQALFVRFIRFGTWLMGLLVAAIIVFPNLTPTRALGGLGLASVAFGLIFKEFFENFFAGVLILWRFPFDAGDYIQCGEVEGQVVEISVRMTLIRQVSDELVLAPNKFLTANPVKVLTNPPKRRVLEVINVGYGGSVEEAAEAIRRATARCATVDKGHRVEVLAKCLCPNSVDIELAWWTDPTPYDVRRSRGEVLAAVKRALEEAGVEMPTPYRTVVFKNPLAVRTAPAQEEPPTD